MSIPATTSNLDILQRQVDQMHRRSAECGKAKGEKDYRYFFEGGRCPE